MDIRDNLKKIIEENGYIKAVIAKKSGLTPAILSGILNKNRKLEANEMFNICETLGVTPEQLRLYEQPQKTA